MHFSRRIACFAFIAAFIGLGGCARTDEGMRGRTSETPPDVAHVRYVNALSPQTGADLYFGDLKLFDAAARTAAGYVQVPAERREFALRQTGAEDAEPVAKNSEGLQRDAHYTVIAFEEDDGKPAIRVVSDEEPAPSSGTAKVRIVDAAGKAGGFDLYAVGRDEKLAGQTRLGMVSQWQEVTPVEGPIELRAEDKSVAPISGVTLQAGKLYTFVVKDGATAKQPLQVVTLENTATKLPGLPPPLMPVGAD